MRSTLGGIAAAMALASVDEITAQEKELAENTGSTNRELKPSDRVPPHVRAAARAEAERGGSPRAQIDAARKAAGVSLVYNAHQGSREIARRAKRIAAGKLKASD